MLGEIVKALEFLTHTLSKSSDRKREDLAKELLRIYLAINDVVSRGRMIIDLRPHVSQPNITPASIQLLSQQLGAIQELTELLTSGNVSNILKLHVPLAARDLEVFFQIKVGRVWFHLSQLITDGEALGPKAWVEQMEERWGHALPLEYVKKRANLYGSLEHNVEMTTSPEDLTKAREVLDEIAKAGEEIRSFLIGKFKLEDLL